MATKRFQRPLAVLAISGLAALAALAVLGPVLWGEAAEETAVSSRLAPASPEHPFGTDQLGRDILARVLVASRLSVLLAFGATAIAAVAGIILGLVPTVLPARLRRVCTGIIDILMIFPWLLLALFFSVIWGSSAVGAMLAVAFASVPGYARLAYNLGSSAMGQDYIKAARIVGVGPVGVLVRHVLPNIGRPLVVNIASHAATALLAFAALSFLGLGVQTPAYDWGSLLAEGLVLIYVNPMAAVGPGIAVVAAGLVVTLVSLIFSEDSGPSRRRPSRGRGAGTRTGPGDPARATIPGDRVTLVNVSPPKGGELLYELADRMPDVGFLAVRGSYGDQVDYTGLPNVEQLDHVPADRMPELVYARTRVLLMPSDYESYGRAGVEAMCSGIPVIAHPTEGLREALGDAGTFLDRTDLARWSHSIRRLLQEPERWDEASAAASTRAAELDAEATHDMTAWCDHIEGLPSPTARSHDVTAAAC